MKRSAAVLLALLLILPLCACGEDRPIPHAQPEAPGSAVVKNDAALPEELSSLPEEEPPEDSVTTRLEVCRVMEGTGRSILTIPLEGEPGELAFVDGSHVDETNGALAPGAVIDVIFSGEILETWPGSLYGVKSVTVVEQRDSLLPLYGEILDGLYEQDSGLNPDGKELETVYYGFDLTHVQNLRDMEKSALTYLFTCDHNEYHNAEALTGTFRELCDQGYIDEENLYWENGVLFSLTDESAKHGKFSFDMSKWRGGLGAIGYEKCTAKFQDGSWGYELSGNCWIA